MRLIGFFSACKHIHSPLHGGLNLGYFLLDINSNKTLSWPPTVQPSQSNKNIQSQAIKTASLDHITAKCSLLQPSRVPLVPLWNKLEWRERNPVACAVRKGKKGKRGGEGTRWELAADCLCNALHSAIGRARRPCMSAHFIQTFHYSPAAIATETKPPQQLCYCWTLAKGVPGAEVERGRWVEWLIRRGTSLWDTLWHR